MVKGSHETSRGDANAKQSKSGLRRTSKKKLALKWSDGEYNHLVNLVRTHGEDWNAIASKFPAKTAKQCMQKFKNSQRSAKKGNWTNDEDEILLAWVGDNGATKWTECSKQIRGRCGKQCRERWVNILNPDVKKGNWTDEEQLLIFESLHKYFTSWSAMSKVLPGRTENSIKNYFYSSVRRLKSNPITHFLKELYISRTVPPAKISEHSAFLNTEIKKLNQLSQEICKFLLKQNVSDSEFKRFLLSVIFMEEGAMASAPATLPRGSYEFGSISVPEVKVPVPHTREETQAAFELVKKFLESTGGDSQIDQVIKSIEEKIQTGADLPPPNPQLVTLKIPYCWNCHNLQCAQHGRTA